MQCRAMQSLIGLIFAAAAAVVSTASCAENPPPLRVGGILTLTGEGSPYGINGQRGIILALEEINRAGGVRGRRIEVLWEDETGGKAEPAVTAFRRLTAMEGVRFIFGPSYQDASLALLPLAKREGVLLLSPSSPRLGAQGFFSTWIDPVQEVEIVAAAVLKRHKRIAVLSSEQSWDAMVSKAFREEVLRRGGEVVSFQEASPDASDVKAEVMRVKGAGPDAVFIGSYTLFAKFVPALKRLGVDVPYYSIEADSAVIKAANGAAQGLIFAGPAIPESGFAEAFRRRFAAPPDIPAYQGYDLAKLFARAVEAAGEDPKDVAGWLDDFGYYHGAAGDYRAAGGRLTFSAALFAADGDSYRRLP